MMKTPIAKSRFPKRLIVAGLMATGIATWLGVDRPWSQVLAQAPPPAADVAPAAPAAPVVAPPSVTTTRIGQQAVQVYQAAQAQGQQGNYIFQPAPNIYHVEVVSSEQSEAGAAAERKARELLGKYAATEDAAEREKLVEELKAAVSDQFDARQEMREKELARLEEQLKKLKGLHDRRIAEKSQIIDDRVRQLLRDADGLGWGNDEGRSFTPSPYAPARINWTPQDGSAPRYPVTAPLTR